MVRLVFRPYTQVRRSICTSESLRASTRVSPGFALLKHSSPSFGSQHVRSHSNLSPGGSWSADGAGSRPSHPSHFHCAHGFDTPALAHMLDSLVRVSRRGKENHFVRVQSREPHDLGPDRDRRCTQFQMQAPYLRDAHASRGQEPTLTKPAWQRPGPRDPEAIQAASQALLPFGSLSAISSTF